jgi:undecaprenyl diphosphate synthase
MERFAYMPRHVAITMDGNRRWAKAHSLSTKEGHLAGAKRVEPLVDFAARAGIEVMTFYAFSTENFSRKEEEKQSIFEVFNAMLHDPVTERMKKNGVQVRVIGDLEKFPRMIQQRVRKLVHDSAQNDRIIVNFALNYGGRQEITQAVKQIVAEGVAPEEVSEEVIASHLYTAGLPDPDLLIRPGGEQRLSNLLPWQSAYSELYFSDTLWPNFDIKEFSKALIWYDERAQKRRFGK